MNTGDILGTTALVSGLVDTGAHLPQIFHLFKIKDSRSISLYTWWLWLVAIIPVMVYLLYLNNIYLFLIELANILFVITVIILTYKYRKK